MIRAPPAVLALLRKAYFDVLAAAEPAGGGDSESSEGEGESGAGSRPSSASAYRLQPDPTSVQRRPTDRSPIYDGTMQASPHAPMRDGRAAPDPPPVEWAALPEALHAEVLEGLRPAVEAWCGHALAPVRFFGVRRYLRGAALDMHVDSDPMVRAIGVSITVDVEGLEEPWLLKGAGAEGEAAAAALPVGRCFVYEACRVRHHRPTPLRASVFANAFAHYTLAAWS